MFVNIIWFNKTITRFMPKYCDIFWSFFKVGAFTIGGGYAMIPLMQRELVDRHRWLSEEEFGDCVALSQTMPGVFAVNMATLTGQRLRGVRGALTAIIGNVTVPILAILLLATFFRAFRDNVYVQRIFMGLRPCVVALIAAPVFTLWKNAYNSPYTLRFRVFAIIIPIISALLIWLLGVNPILIVLAAAFLGLLYSKLRSKN